MKKVTKLAEGAPFVKMRRGQTKVRIIPGRAVTGKDIKSRLKNRSLMGSTYTPEDYSLDETMAAFTKMSRVEQIEAVRKNNKFIRDIQERLEKADTLRKQKEEEIRIENEIKKRMEASAKEEISKQSNPKS